MKKHVALSWSGGKDCAMALQILQQRSDVQLSALLTTFTADGEVTMHGVPRSLIQQQAAALDLPLVEHTIPNRAGNDVYEASLLHTLSNLKSSDTDCVAFGDLFLQDIRQYRESVIQRASMQCLFPLWQQDTADLTQRFTADGFHAIVCCTDDEALPSEFCGREFDRGFLSDLPESVDPCGENGEFHTFVFDGPIFSSRIPFRTGCIDRGPRFTTCRITGTEVSTTTPEFHSLRKQTL